jgi:predicted small secreted protein
MIHLRISLAAAAAVLSACATLRGSGVDARDSALPDYLANIPIYWAGTLPRCPVEAVARVAATSRAALRERAYENGADAVVDGRMQSRLTQRSFTGSRGALPMVSYVYSGIAVRLASKCMP